MKLNFDRRIYGRYKRRGSRLRGALAKKLKRNRRHVIVALLAGVIAILIGVIIGMHSSGVKAQTRFDARQASWLKTRQGLTDELQRVRGQKTNSEAEAKKNADKAADLQRQLDDVNHQLQAKREQQSLLAKAAAVVAPKAYAEGVTNCGDNMYKQYIYSHESGCNTASVNSIGCAGIGQACPGSKLPCSLSDFACQDAYFTNYAVSTYGSWQGAYNAWQRQGWW